MTTCEHCGSDVKLAPVCAKCGREHSKEFFIEAVKGEKMTLNAIAIWVILVGITAFIPDLDIIDYLVAFCFEMVIASIIGFYVIPVNDPKEIKLDNGKILKI